MNVLYLELSIKTVGNRVMNSIVELGSWERILMEIGVWIRYQNFGLSSMLRLFGYNCGD